MSDERSFGQGVTRRHWLRMAAIGALGSLLAACQQAAPAPPAATTVPAAAAPATAAPATATAAPATAAPATAAPATAAPATAAPPANAALVDAAKKEGTGTIYFSIDPTSVQRVLDAFTGVYGIPIEVQTLTSGPLAQRLTAEIEAGNVVADMIINTDLIFTQQAADNGWLESAATLPQFAQWPAAFKSDRFVTVALTPFGIVWNTNEVTQAPTAWEDVLDSKYSGKIVVSDPKAAPSVIEFFYALGQKYGDAFLTKLGQQQLRPVPTTIVAAQQVAAGAAALSFPMVGIVLVPLLAQNAPIGQTFLNPTTVARNLAASVAKAPHPNVGKLLLNFLMTTDAQALLNRDAYSPVPNVPGTRPLPELASSTMSDALARRDQIIQMLAV